MRKVLFAVHLLVMAGFVAWLVLRATPVEEPASANVTRAANPAPAQKGLELDAPTAPAERELARATPARRATTTERARLVLRAEDPRGAALSGTHVRVAAVEDGADSAEFLHEGDTDVLGELALDVPAEARLRVEAQDRHAPGRLTGLRLAPIELDALAPRETRRVTVRFAPACEREWRARVVRAEDGAPLANAALVELVYRSTPFGLDALDPVVAAPFARIDAEGRARLCTSIDRRPEALVTAPGRGPQYARLPQAAEPPGTEHLFALAPAARLRLRVVDRAQEHADDPARAGSDASSPREPLTVELSAPVSDLTPPAEHDAETGGGSVRWERAIEPGVERVFEDLPASANLSLSIERGPLAVYRHAAPLLLAPGETRELEVVLGVGTRVVVRVVDQHDAPVARRSIGLTRGGIDNAAGREAALLPANVSPHFEFLGATDAQGACTFEGIAAGEWWVALAPQRYNANDGDAVPSIARRIELRELDTEVEVTLRAPRGLYVRGTIETPDGRLFPPGAKPGTSANVFLLATALDAGGGTSGEPVLDGTFALGPLAEGRYRIETFSRGYAPIDPVIARAGGPPIVIRMQLGARIVGRVTSREPGQALQCDVVLSRVDADVPETLGSTDGNGALAFDGLAPGEYVVSAFT